MNWKGYHPVVELVTTTHQIGGKLTKEVMDLMESQCQQLSSLDEWFVDIICSLPVRRDS